MDMRRLILKKILSEPTIFNRHLKFILMLRLKKRSNFPFSFKPKLSLL
jgi:hypothetical protein